MHAGMGLQMNVHVCECWADFVESGICTFGVDLIGALSDCPVNAIHAAFCVVEQEDWHPVDHA